jgi:hypothetical protein
MAKKAQHEKHVSEMRRDRSARYVWFAALIMIAGLLVFWRLGTEWFWKLAPQILAGIFVFVVGILDYVWVGEQTKRHKLLRLLLFFLIVASLIGTVGQTVKAEVDSRAREAQLRKEEERRQKNTVMQVLEDVAHESEWNSVRLREKEFATGTSPAIAERLLEFRLMFLKHGNFIATAPLRWGRDLPLLKDYGDNGKSAYKNIVSMYETIHKLEHDEQTAIPLIESEKRKDMQALEIDNLHEEYRYLQRQCDATIHAVRELHTDLQTETKK